jgi:hypothetical protein
MPRARQAHRPCCFQNSRLFTQAGWRGEQDEEAVVLAERSANEAESPIMVEVKRASRVHCGREQAFDAAQEFDG